MCVWGGGGGGGRSVCRLVSRMNANERMNG